MQITIDIVSDTVCPWCWIGKRRLETAMARRPGYDYRVRWRPFQLNPDMPADGIERERYLRLKFGGAEQAVRIYAAIEDAGAAEGLPFNFSSIVRQPNTFDSHRLIRWSASSGHQHDLVEGLFRRYFEDGQDIGDCDVLVAAASDVGMDGALVRELLRNDSDSAEVRGEEQIARQTGINGVPCFIVQQHYAVSGAQDPSVLVDVFDLVAREPAEAAPPTTPAPAGD